MANLQISLQVWKSNGANIRSIQGEAGSRTLDVTFLDSTGQPINLAGCTPRMYVGNRVSPPPFNDGTILDAVNGKAEFVITSDMLSRPGDWGCEYLLVGSNYPPLKANGLTLHVDASSTETEISNTNEWHTVSRMIVKVEESSAIAQQAATDAQKAVTDANGAISGINAKEAEITTAESARQSDEDTRKTAETARADAETARKSAESSRVTAEESRASAESARVTAENKRQTDTQTAISGANTAADKANHTPQYGDNGNWQSWNGTAYVDSGKPWKGEKGDKGDKGDPFEYGTSYDTLAALQTAYPTGDTKGHLVGQVAYIWDGTAWKPTSIDMSDYQTQTQADAKYVPQTRTVNGKALSADVTLSNADVGAAPISHTSETVSTESGVHGIRWHDSKLQAKKSDGTWEDISTGSGGGFPPADVSGLAAATGNGQVTILWGDPADTVLNGTTIVKWAGSKLVRKEGAYPASPTDGILLVDSKTRDQYKTVGYADTGLTNGTTYYYAVFPYSDVGVVNANEANRTSATPQAYVKYGVRWHKSESPALERLYDSASFTFQAKSASAAYHSDFDGKPIYKDIKICNVQNGAVTAYEGEAGFSRTGSNGDVMAEIPKFWYKVEDSSDYRDYIISDGPLDGFAVAPRHAVCDDYPNGLGKIYVGAYEATSGYKSVSGAAPLASLTRAQFRTGFTGRGTGYVEADWATQFELGILMMVETANLDTQSTVGFGYAASNSSAVNTGGTDTLGAVTGTAGSNNSVIWRGLENLWGNVYEWRDGVNFNATDSYVCVNPSKYKDDTGTDYTKLAYSKSASDGFISSLGFDSNAPWAQIPTASSGSASTYFCDQYYQSTGWCVASVGGHWGNGSPAGFFYLASGSASTYSDTHLGSRLLVLPQ